MPSAPGAVDDIGCRSAEPVDRNGVQRLLLTIPTGTGDGDRRIGTIASAAVDGLVIYSPPDHDPRLDAAPGRHQPPVIVEGPRRARASWVGLDDEAAAAALA
jgi:DNA-binding LacI/PurR family transcriptional regulator